MRRIEDQEAKHEQENNLVKADIKGGGGGGERNKRHKEEYREGNEGTEKRRRIKESSGRRRGSRRIEKDRGGSKSMYRLSVVSTTLLLLSHCLDVVALDFESTSA